MNALVRALPIVWVASSLACASPSPPRATEPPKELALPPVIDVLEPDVDADGIRGAADRCPTDPETYNDILDADGCPDDRLSIVPPHHVAIVARVRAKGFGEYCPLDPAHSEAAWEKNRRTIFRIAKYEGVRGHDELGCAAATALGVVSLPIP